MLVNGGRLLLGLPTAHRDALVWNAHRVYGPARLPLLLRGFDVIAAFGVPPAMRTREPASTATIPKASWDADEAAHLDDDDYALALEPAALEIVVFFLERGGQSSRSQQASPSPSGDNPPCRSAAWLSVTCLVRFVGGAPRKDQEDVAWRRWRVTARKLRHEVCRLQPTVGLP